MATSDIKTLIIHNTSVTNTLLNMFNNELTSDVYFLFHSSDGQVQRIPAHKSVLAAASKVFEKMFYGELRETGDVNITDCSPESFKEFVALFYLKKCELTNENILEVIYLSNKYDFAGGVRACSSYMERTVTTETMCWLFDLTLTFQMVDLRKFCEDEIIDNTKAIFNTELFNSCTPTVLGAILAMDCLSCNEVEILDAFMDWVDAACKRDQVNKLDEKMFKQKLNDWGLGFIRFPSMTLQQFNESTSKYADILTSDEIADILSYINTQCPLEISRRFNTKARSARKSCRKWADKNILSCVRYDRKLTQPYCFETFISNAEISFSSNKAIILHGIQTAPINAVGTYEYDENGEELKRQQLEVTIEVANSEELLLRQNFTLQEDGEGKYVKFSMPIIVDPDEDYDIRLMIGLEMCHFYYLRDRIQQHHYAARLGSGIEIQLVYEDDADSNDSNGDFANTRDLILELLFEKM